MPVKHPRSVHEDSLHCAVAISHAAAEHLSSAATNVHDALAAVPIICISELHTPSRQAELCETCHGVLEVVSKGLVALLFIVLYRQKCCCLTLLSWPHAITKHLCPKGVGCMHSRDLAQRVDHSRQPIAESGASFVKVVQFRLVTAKVIWASGLT